MMGKSAISFLVLLAFSYTGISLAGTIQLPQTGQTTCYDSAGTQLPACAGTGQDGDVQEGVVWPVPRFQTGTGPEADCIIDNLTGLMWQKNAGITQRTWQEAFDYVQTLNITETLCGYNDWRLPNVNELESLFNAAQGNTATWLNSQGFQNIQPIEYWSSTTYAGLPDLAWVVRLHDGIVQLREKVGTIPYNPPSVRGVSSGLAKLWQTGQTKCYDASGAELPSCEGTGQDGEAQAGVVWPHPRFTVTGDCVTDNLTGLMWVEAPSPITSTWQAALDSANKLSMCGFDDWRLPNRKEQRSLLHYGEANTALWLEAMGFSSVPMNYVWTSTNYGVGIEASVMNMLSGFVDFYLKTSDRWHAWAVRSPISVTQGTLGTSTVVTGTTGSGFGSKKGKVLIGDLATKIVTWTDTSITCTVKKVPVPVATYDIMVIPYKAASPIAFPSAFTVRSPQIVEVKPGQGSPGDEITIKGQFFSTKKGKIYLEYEKNGQPKKKSCPVKSWDMDPKTGESTIIFKVPKRPEPLRETYPLYITNKVGTTSPGVPFIIN